MDFAERCRDWRGHNSGSFSVKAQHRSSSDQRRNDVITATSHSQVSYSRASYVPEGLELARIVPSCRIVLDFRLSFV